MNRLEALVEVHLDSGIRRFSTDGIVSRNYYWEPRLLSIGDIERQISVLPESFQASDVSIDLADADQAISRLRDEEPFRRRKLKILLGEMDQGESDFITISTGSIDSWRKQGETFSIRAIDDPIAWIDEAVAGFTTDLDTFPTKPANYTGLHLVPILIGAVAVPTGALPAYLIDAAAGQVTYRYVCSHGEINGVTEVFRYGELVQASDYIVLSVNYRSQIFTVLDFATDQRDPQRANEIEISWNGSGWTEDGTFTGAAITNPSRQYEAFLKSQGISVDGPSFTERKMSTTLRHFFE